MGSMGNSNATEYGVLLRVLRGYLVASSSEFGITISKPFSSVHAASDIGALYLDLLKKIEAEISVRKSRFEPIPEVSKQVVVPSELPTLHVSDVAAMLGVSQATVRRLVSDGRLKCRLSRGGHRRFLASDVEALKP